MFKFFINLILIKGVIIIDFLEVVFEFVFVEINKVFSVFDFIGKNGDK